MYQAVISMRRGSQEPETAELSGITDHSTGYEYGAALAEAVRDYMERKISAEATITNDHGMVIHRLLIVPKGGSVMVTEHGAGAIALSHKFTQSPEKLPEKYLVMVNPQQNNNKFYRMVDLGGGEWGAFYGRIGEKQGESCYSNHVSKPHVYPDYMYAIKLQEKLQKGYRDVSDLHGNEDGAWKDAEKFAEIKDPQVAELIRRLMEFADMTIRKNYTVDSMEVTLKMIEEAKKCITTLKEAAEAASASHEAVDAFNDRLVALMHVIPRRIDGAGENGVKRMMAGAVSDFQNIILREQELLDVMEGQVVIHENHLERKGKEKSLLDAMGIEVYAARPEQVRQVEAHLNDSLKPRLKAVYRVINRRTQERFDAYLKEHGGKRRVKVKQFWHGSRNENWISILQKGLVLNPNAVITGKMFGQGVYFAPSAMKSWGYTSGNGAHWTNGTCHTAFMALYATAYGKPYEVFSHDGNWRGYHYGRLRSEHPECSCVHAKADKGMLRNDEVIFYREDQMTINYICEFAA